VPLANHTSLALSYECGAFDVWDVSVAQPVQSVSGVSTREIAAMTAYSENSLLCGFGDGSLGVFDARAPEGLTPAIAIENQKEIVSLCLWPDSVVAGVGYGEGIVSVIDTRMWMVIHSRKTRRPEQLVPIAPAKGDTLSYLVLNLEEVEIVTENPPLSRQSVNLGASLFYATKECFRCAVEYRGGAVVMDDASASFVHALAARPRLRLFDEKTAKLKCEEGVNGHRIERTRRYRRSVHQHSATITCGATIGSAVLTGDELGFVNIWDLAGST
jgi:hypothetical protein